MLLLYAKVRIETITEFIRQAEKHQHHPKMPRDSKLRPQSLSQPAELQKYMVNIGDSKYQHISVVS